jgi:transcriptional regulator GlxA family with amidase domain
MKQAAVVCVLLLAGAAPAASPPKPEHVEEIRIERPRPSALSAGILLLPGVSESELVAPFDVFHDTARYASPGMTVFTVSADGKPVRTLEGLQISPDFAFQNAPPIDVLVLPGGGHGPNPDSKDEGVRAWVKREAGSAKYVVTLGDGAFLLADTGLLDGKYAATFPGHAARFEKLFPSVHVQKDFTYVEDGKFLTSPGGLRSYDTAMALVSRLYGRGAALAIAEGLVMTWPDARFRAFRAPAPKPAEPPAPRKPAPAPR